MAFLQPPVNIGLAIFQKDVMDDQGFGLLTSVGKKVMDDQGFELLTSDTKKVMDES